MNKRFKKLIAVVSAIAMVITSITVYNNTAVRASATATGNGKIYTVTDGSNDGFTGFTCNGLQVFNDVDGYIGLAWGVQVTANTIKVKINDAEVAAYNQNPYGAFIAYSQFKGLSEGEYPIVVTAETEGEAKTVTANATLKIESQGETTTIAAATNPEDVAWDAIDWLGNGTPDAGNANRFKAYILPDNTAKLEAINLQPKDNVNAIYMPNNNSPAKKITVNGKDITSACKTDGAQTFVPVSELKAATYNTVVITTVTNIDLKAFIYNATVEEPVETTVPDESGTTKPEESSTEEETTPGEEFDPSTITDWTSVNNSKTLSYYIADNMADKVPVKPQVENNSSVYIAYALAATFKSVTFDSETMTPEAGAFVRVDLAKFTEGYHKLVVVNFYENESVTIYFKAGKEEETTTAAPIADGTEILKNVEFNGSSNWNEDNLINAVNGGDGTVSFGVSAKDGGDAWSSQLVQNGITLENGKWYVVKYRVTSDVDKNFKLLIQSDGNAGGDWSEFAAITTNVKAGQEVEVTLKFQTTKAANANALLGIMMGYIDAACDAANVKISAVSLKGYTTEPEVTTGSVVISEPEVKEYTVTVDGTSTKVEEGAGYTLGDAKYGYYSDGKMYKAGTEITVTSDMQFASVNELSVTMKTGAGIRYIGTAGIRFESAITSDNMTAVADQNVIKEGTLITAQDIYEANGSQLTLTSPGTKINVVNQGWYKDKEGSYCGSICNIVESNYIREFTAVAYVTIEYTDGTSTTVYSNKGSVRSISQIASAIKADGYRNIEEQYHSVIDSFIR